MSSIHFRTIARESLTRAKAELESNDEIRARYAALELRELMEALTYDRAEAFKEDIPPEEYKTWQPRRLMDVLLDIDPTIDMASTLAIGEQTEFGKPAPPEAMKSLGTDAPLSLKNIKEHYNALGSYLHTPSLDQMMKGSVPDLSRLRVRCQEIIAILEKILSSPIWNVTFSQFATLPQCMNEDCKRPIRKRLVKDKSSMDVQCFSCKAEYKITMSGERDICWNPKQTRVKCNNAACTTNFQLWSHEIKPGTSWRCADCKTLNGIVLGVVTLPEMQDAPLEPKPQYAEGQQYDARRESE